MTIFVGSRISGDSARMKISATGADIILFWKYICSGY
jgi:hypothetical protein